MRVCSQKYRTQPESAFQDERERERERERESFTRAPGRAPRDRRARRGWCARSPWWSPRCASAASQRRAACPSRRSPVAASGRPIRDHIFTRFHKKSHGAPRVRRRGVARRPSARASRRHRRNSRPATVSENSHSKLVTQPRPSSVSLSVLRWRVRERTGCFLMLSSRTTTLQGPSSACRQR